MTEIAQRIVATHERVEREKDHPPPPHPDPSVMSGLRTQLAEAQQREAAAVKALEDFKTRVVEIGGQAAEDNDWCGEYENIMARLGLQGSQDYRVVVEVTFRTTTTMGARTEAIAQQRVLDADWDIDLGLSSDYGIDHTGIVNFTRRVITNP